MADSTSIERVVEKAVARILEIRIPALREELVRAVAADLLPELANTNGGHASLHEDSQAGTTADLLTAISAIHSGATQKDILRALLDNTAPYSGRCALFVIKSGLATGWKGRGFDNNDAVKDFSLDLRSGVAARAMQERSASGGASTDVDARFMTHFRAPADGRVLFLPLVLKDKIAAVVYADAGTHPGGTLDSASLQLLVAATSAWLEVISLRKQAQKEGVTEFSERMEPAPATFTESSIPDPFASRPPLHAQSSVPVPQQSAVPTQVAAPPATMAMAASATDSSTRVASVKPAATLSAEDEETHRKAQRFARLLIDEIKLYNQAVVDEGRQNHDLYDRLKEDIEKSRITYQKRYGNTAAADSDYFNRELARILAEDNVSLLGVNYPH
jgi:hypothetical protein